MLANLVIFLLLYILLFQRKFYGNNFTVRNLDRVSNILDTTGCHDIWDTPYLVPHLQGLLTPQEGVTVTSHFLQCTCQFDSAPKRQV